MSEEAIVLTAVDMLDTALSLIRYGGDRGTEQGLRILNEIADSHEKLRRQLEDPRLMAAIKYVAESGCEPFPKNCGQCVCCDARAWLAQFNAHEPAGDHGVAAQHGGCRELG